MRMRWTVAGALGTSAILALAGCGDSTPAPEPQATSPTTAQDTPTGSPQPTAEPTGAPTGEPTASLTGPGPTSPPGTARHCATAELAISPGRQEGAAGSLYQAVVFRNTGRRGTCRMQGYPGVAGLDASGRPVATARHTGGQPGPAVVLATGQSASVVVIASTVPGAGATCPPDYAGLRVTPPRQVAAVRLTVSLPACGGLRVGPIVPGVTGR
jgi:hypothetical protein